MNKKIVSVALVLILVLSSVLFVYAHSGRTDANGGHWNRKTGTYHYHNSGYSIPTYSGGYTAPTTSKPSSTTTIKTKKNSSSPQVIKKEVAVNIYPYNSPSQKYTAIEYQNILYIPVRKLTDAMECKLEVNDSKSISILPKYYKNASSAKVNNNNVAGVILRDTKNADSRIYVDATLLQEIGVSIKYDPSISMYRISSKN